MFKKINLDHCYNEDKNFKLFKLLGKSGFVLEPQMVEHPGKAFCKFIALQSGNSRKNFYLEFVHIGKGGIEEKTPGLSFSYLSNLEALHKKLKSIVKTSFNHKNYDWKKNSEDHLPGWNMLNFNRKPIRNIFTWFTEYEHYENKKPKKKPKAHPNTVYSVHGIKLKLTSKSKTNLEMILHKKLSKKNKLSDGSYLYIEDSEKDHFESIILNCKSLKKFHSFFNDQTISLFGDKPAIVIPSYSKNKKMWNLTVIEN
jgi:hypothetical protein